MGMNIDRASTCRQTYVPYDVTCYRSPSYVTPPFGGDLYQYRPPQGPSLYELPDEQRTRTGKIAGGTIMGLSVVGGILSAIFMPPLCVLAAIGFLVGYIIFAKG